MSKETPPLEEREHALVKVLEILGPLDPETQARIIRAVIVFLGMELLTK